MLDTGGRDRHQIATPNAVLMDSMHGEIPLGSGKKAGGLGRRHSVLRSPGMLAAPGLDLYEHQLVSVQYHEIQLSRGAMPVAVNESVAVPLEKHLRHALAVCSELR